MNNESVFGRYCALGFLPRRAVANLAAGLLAFTGLFAAQSGFARDVPAETPPASVISLAQQAAAQIGKELSANPSAATLTSANYTSNTLWELVWRGTVLDVRVSVDATRGKVVRITDDSEDASIRTAVDAGTSPLITDVQAEAVTATMTQYVGVNVGAWQARQTQLWQSGSDYRNWRCEQDLFVDGYQSEVERVIGYVNPFTGHLIDWKLVDGCQYIAPQNSLVPLAQAESVADAAFEQFAGSYLATGETIAPTNGGRGPTWQAPSLDGPVSRLAYAFDYDIPATQSRQHALVEARVDAETGELWDVYWATPSGGRSKPVPSSARFALLKTLCAERQAAPLEFAVASGRPEKGSAPGVGARRFSWQVKGKAITFAFNEKARRLTWQTDDGKWTGLVLPEKQTAALAAWLKTPALTEAATTGKP